MADLKKVKIGSWLACNDGIFEVVSKYDNFHDWFLVREVIFDSRNYTTSSEEVRMTSQEVKKSELMNEDW